MAENCRYGVKHHPIWFYQSYYPRITLDYFVITKKYIYLVIDEVLITTYFISNRHYVFFLLHFPDLTLLCFPWKLIHTKVRNSDDIVINWLCQKSYVLKSIVQDFVFIIISQWGDFAKTSEIFEEFVSY